MTNRRTHKKTAPRSSRRGAAIDGDVSGSAIVTGDGNVVQILTPADPVATALHQLRPPVSDFVGREQAIETLMNALRHRNRACISGINGMGGIGKTELALLVAQHLSNDYPDAQFFINLQGTDASSRLPQEVMATCIRAFLGPEVRLPEDLDQLSQLYRSQLSGKRALLLFDNAADGIQVRPLLPPTGCALLVTSRQAITLPGMTPLTLNTLSDKEARELLLEIAPRAAPVAEQICKLCGYLPLAIRAAGSLLVITVDLDPIDYAAQLQDERNRIERIGAEGVEVGVAASFNLSYTRLTLEAARVFRLLSVFPGTFDAIAAEMVCDDKGHVCLSELVRRSLVLYDTSTMRYRLHDLTQLFAKAKLSTAERAAGYKRHATHYKDVLAAANDFYFQGGEALARGLTLFDLEWANIQAGHNWVVEQGVERDEDVARLGMTYPDAGINLLDLRQHPRELICWLEVALTAARGLKDRAGEGNALGSLGLVYADLGETKRAIQLHKQHLTIAHELGYRRGEGTALNNLGNAYADLPELQRAIQCYEQALIIFRELGERRNEGTTLSNLGKAYYAWGGIERAIQFYEKGLTIARELGDHIGEGIALGNLGLAYADLGETQRAIQLYEQRLTIARGLGDRRGEGTTLWNMSLALDQLGKRVHAIQCAEQSLTLHEQIEDPFAPQVRAKLAAWREKSEE